MRSLSFSWYVTFMLFLGFVGSGAFLYKSTSTSLKEARLLECMTRITAPVGTWQSDAQRRNCQAIYGAAQSGRYGTTSAATLTLAAIDRPATIRGRW